MTESVRSVETRDAETVMEVVRTCGLFAPDEVPILRHQLERSLAGRVDRGEFWLAAFDENGIARGVAFCVEEALTDRVWNLLFIGVSAACQGVGVGSCVLRAVEDRLREDAQRMLIIETTNGPDFEGTRAFYKRHDYTEEGTVRDFYASGAHKIAFRKILSSQP